VEISRLFTRFFRPKCLQEQLKHARSSTKISMRLPTYNRESLITLKQIHICGTQWQTCIGSNPFKNCSSGLLLGCCHHRRFLSSLRAGKLAEMAPRERPRRHGFVQFASNFKFHLDFEA
jgi:hypothetical protein